jgi:hypothetical protein
MREYPEALLEEIRNALKSDSQFNFKQEGNYLRFGVCPNCGEKECFVSLNKPFRVNCGRLNNCRWSATSRELFPEIFENLSRRHPSTPENSNATADAYMSQVRGFSLEKIKGMYIQANAKHQKKEEYYPAVKVIISQTCYWLRIINADDVRRNGDKAKIIQIGNRGYKDYGWVPPEMKFEENDEIWITEGIFKSMAFLHIGKKSISGLSANNLPRDIIKEHSGKNITWILAEDNDNAGRDNTIKFKREIEAMGERVAVAFPQIGEDWDDVFRDERLNEQYIQDSFYRGFYYLTESYQLKAFYHYCKYNYTHSIIDYRNALYCYKIDNKKFQDTREDERFKYPDSEYGWNLPRETIDKYFSQFNSFAEVKKICPCKPEFLYIEKDIVTQERTNTFYVEFANHTPSMLLNSDGTIYKSADNFSNGLLKHTGFAPFTGSNNDLAILHERWFNSRIKFVRGVPFAGYEPETKIYVFPDFAYHNGQYQKISKHGFFTFGRNSVKCNLSGLNFRKADEFSAEWIHAFYEAFSLNGMVLLSWWLGTLFAEQIRAKQDSWPFLEYTGEPGAGKSTQLRFMWRCLGVEGYEGFDPNKTTLPGRSRQMTQGSNLPVVLLEADRHDSGRKNVKSFDFSELKNLFNGGVIRTTGAKTAGSEVRNLEFRGGILISQNAEVDGEPAILERIVHCHCTKDHFNDQNAKLANKLRDMTVQELGGFIHAVLRNERKLLDGYFRSFEKCYKKLMERDNGQVNNWRILLNHAQINAWLHQLPTIFGTHLKDAQLAAAEDYIWTRAISRQQRLSGDHILLEQFWEVYEYLHERNTTEGIQELLNHSNDPKQIAINMPHFQEIAGAHRQNIASTSELLPLFKGCKRHQCLGVKPVRSAIFKKIIKCWVFRVNNEDEV